MSGFWKMSIEAAEEARLLLAAGKSRGATSRAYYAMFDAARAALTNVDPALVRAKTHQTIIGRFSQHIIQGRGLDPDLGRFLNTTEELRISADYDFADFDIEEARITVARMEQFLAAIANLLGEQCQ